MRFFFFLHDPETGITYQGPSTRSLEIRRGETGYAEFAGKVMNILHADHHEGHGYRWTPPSIWRFDEDGFVDQDYALDTMRAEIDKAFSSNPYHPAKSADWKLAMRRADAGKDFLDWTKNPEVRERLEDFVLEGKRHPKLLSTRRLTMLKRT